MTSKTRNNMAMLAVCVPTAVVVSDDAAIAPRIALITRATKPIGLDEGNTVRTYWTPDGKRVKDPSAIVPQLERLQRGFPSSDELRLFVCCDSFAANTSGHIEFPRHAGRCVGENAME